MHQTPLGDLGLESTSAEPDAASGPDLASLRDLARRMGICTYSTCFSGIDSPGTSFAQLRAALGAIIGTAVDDPEHVHAIDARLTTEIVCLFLKLKPMVMSMSLVTVLYFNLKHDVIRASTFYHRSGRGQCSCC